jgi:hypothetical protein
MTSPDRAPAAIWRVACRAARCVADVVEECNYAQRRLYELRMDPERYVFNSHMAPATYGEFLFRTSGPPWREPTARERAAGAKVCQVASRGASKRRTRH